MSKKQNSNGKEETPLEMLVRTYPRNIAKKSQEPYKQFDEVIQAAMDDNGDMEQLHLWQESNPDTLETIFECFKKSKFVTLKSIRLWKTRLGDKGLEALCAFIAEAKELTILDLLENGITAKGCESLGKLFMSFPVDLKIKRLMMDHNRIGDSGLKSLCHGLRFSPNIEEVSLTYCNLDSKAADYIQQLLMYVDSKLEVLNIQGNMIKANGAYQILRALEMNKQLRVCNLADNQIGDEKLFVDQLMKTLKNNNSIRFLNLSHNGIYEDTASQMLEIQKQKKQTRIDLTDRFKFEFAEEYNKFMSKIKLKPSKKKGKKKK